MQAEHSGVRRGAARRHHRRPDDGTAHIGECIFVFVISTDADCAFVKKQCAEFAAAVGLRLNFKPGKSETLCNAVLQENESCFAMHQILHRRPLPRP